MADLFFDPSLGFFLEASRPLRPRRFFHQDTQQMVPTAIIQVPIFRPKKSKHLCFLSNIHHPSSQRQRNSNRGAKKRPPRRLRVAGCCSPSSRCNFQGIQGTLAHGDAELLLLFYKHTSEFRSEKERKKHKVLVS